MVADPDPEKSEGGDSREVRRVGGGGGAEDMEGRSGLTLLLRKSRYHTAVLSLTLVYIIFFLVCSTCAAAQLRAYKNVCRHQVPDRSVPVS